MKAPNTLTSKLLRSSADPVATQKAEPDPFVLDLARLLLTFFAVVIFDLIVVSLMTHRLRFWFPLWLDPHWASRRDPWVVYSQSYFAGIFLLPVLCRIIDRDFLARFGAARRAIFWSLCAITFVFVIWWKGALMIQYNKQYELVGYGALTALLWIIFARLDILPQRFRCLPRSQMLAGLLFGISVFLLVMSVLDPVAQVGLQSLPWSSELVIEVGFFIPSGCVLMMLSRRLRP